MARIARTMTSSESEPAAANDQARRSVMKLAINMESVMAFAPPSKAGVMKKPSESRKTKVAPPRSPGRASGK